MNDPGDPTFRRAIARSNQFPSSPFPNGQDGHIVGHHDSLSAIRSMIMAEDLSVVFQPIADMQTLRIYAYEALVRCAQPAFRNPEELFRRAVEERCTGRLGRMIREVAIPLCRGVPVFLNAHPVELQERWLVRPDDPIYFHDHEVFLEVTESMPLTHRDLCRDVVAELRRRGNIHVVVDDLGAGYSNLKHIADLEPRIVKIDRGLVMGVAENPRQHRLVSGIVRLCADLGADVVAEGIETEDEFRACRDAGVQYGQGYLLARPAFPLPVITAAARALA